jgi:hypothetical protein
MLLPSSNCGSSKREFLFLGCACVVLSQADWPLSIGEPFTELRRIVSEISFSALFSDIEGTPKRY